MKSALKSRTRLWLAAVVAVLVIMEILLLKPSTLDVNEGLTKKSLFKDLSQMVQTQMKDDEVRYTIQGFRYTSVEGETKQWEMNSDTALLYDASKKVVASRARIKMFDATGQITYIEGDEAHYKMGTKDFELFRNVKVTFPDGFSMKTEQAAYSAATQIVSSPSEFAGESLKTKTDWLQVWGRGFSASRKDPLVHILAETHAKIHRFETKEVNDVRSDLAVIDRFQKKSLFTMDQAVERVESTLGTMTVKSKRQEVNYDGAAHQLNYMTAYEEVYIKENDPKLSREGLKYATCQRADFVTKDNKILMTGFPSVYQESDTVTGELITVYRSKNLVEVSQANGYHESK